MRVLRTWAAIAGVVAIAACTVKQTETPDLTGPSNFVVPPPAPPPTAQFNFTPSSPTANLAVAFDGSISCPESGTANLCAPTERTITAYSWNFGDGITDSGPTVSHSFRATGSFNVSLTVTNDKGLTGSVSRQVTVAPGTPPTARFVFSPTNPSIGQTVNFNAAQSIAGPGHTIASYAWDFGDGGKATGANPTHAFGASGNYNVVLTVTDEVGQTGSTTLGVPVATTPGVAAPTAEFVFSPTDPSAGQSVLFNATQSRAAAGHSITGYSWNFGDGSTGSGVTVSHPFSSAGTYSIVLVVTDDLGVTATASKTVSVSPNSQTPPPTAVFTFSPAAPALGDTVFFNASNSTPAAGRTIASYKWTFGDNTAPVTTSSATTTHVYSASSGAGSYTVTLVVTDDAVPPRTGTSSQTVPVGSPPAPTARFTFSPTSPVVGDSVIFDTAGTTTAQGQSIARYDWNFGDGTPITTCRVPAQGGDAAACTGGTNRTIAHAFAAAATYNVNLIVTDTAGRTGSTSGTVSVSSPNPTARLSLIKAGGNSIIADASASSATGTATIVNYSFNWGDNSGTTSGPTAIVNHVFPGPGTYTVILTVTDSHVPALSATISQSITVP